MCILVGEAIEFFGLFSQGRLKVEVTAVLILSPIVFIQL